jgi:hypothetical protein
VYLVVASWRRSATTSVKWMQLDACYVHKSWTWVYFLTRARRYIDPMRIVELPKFLSQKVDVQIPDDLLSGDFSRITGIAQIVSRGMNPRIGPLRMAHRFSLCLALDSVMQGSWHLGMIERSQT